MDKPPEPSPEEEAAPPPPETPEGEEADREEGNFHVSRSHAAAFGSFMLMLCTHSREKMVQLTHSWAFQLFFFWGLFTLDSRVISTNIGRNTQNIFVWRATVVQKSPFNVDSNVNLNNFLP